VIDISLLKTEQNREFFLIAKNVRCLIRKGQSSLWLRE